MILLLTSAVLLLVLHLETEDGGDLYLRNVELSELTGIWLNLPLVSACISTGILFDSEEECGMFLRNVELSELLGFSLSLPPTFAGVLLV
jgi:hypothetical protein